MYLNVMSYNWKRADDICLAGENIYVCRIVVLQNVLFYALFNVNGERMQRHVWFAQMNASLRCKEGSGCGDWSACDLTEVMAADWLTVIFTTSITPSLTHRITPLWISYILSMRFIFFSLSLISKEISCSW